MIYVFIAWSSEVHGSRCTCTGAEDEKPDVPLPLGPIASFRCGVLIRRLSGQRGHSWTCCWLDPVANDPGRHVIYELLSLRVCFPPSTSLQTPKLATTLDLAVPATAKTGRTLSALFPTRDARFLRHRLQQPRETRPVREARSPQAYGALAPVQLTPFHYL